MTETPTDEETAESVPFSVRLRLAVGARRPPDYRNWALSRIESEGWRLMHGMTRITGFWLGALSGLTLMSLLRPGIVGLASWIGFGVAFPIAFGLIGAVIGALWPDYVRRRNIDHQLNRGPR